MSNVHPLEVVDRGSETQLQVGKNLKSMTSAQFREFHGLTDPIIGVHLTI